MFRATAPLVMAPVTVQDGDGRPVDGLTEADFELLDNGEPRRLEAETVYHPVALVCLVESSYYARAALQLVKRAAPLVGHLITGERGLSGVVEFGDRVETVLPLQGNQAEMARAIQRIIAGGTRVRLLDAVVAGVRVLRAAPANYRRVMLIFSERRDQGSETRLEEAVTLAQRENVALYACPFSPTLTEFTAKPQELTPAPPMNLMALFTHLRQAGKEDAIAGLTAYTGGRAVGFLKYETLEQALTSIGEELHSQYLLSFVPPEKDAGEFHRLEVRVKQRPELRVRTRPGYWLVNP